MSTLKVFRNVHCNARLPHDG